MLAATDGFADVVQGRLRWHALVQEHALEMFLGLFTGHMAQECDVDEKILVKAQELVLVILQGLLPAAVCMLFDLESKQVCSFIFVVPDLVGFRRGQ